VGPTRPPGEALDFGAVGEEGQRIGVGVVRQRHMRQTISSTRDVDPPADRTDGSMRARRRLPALLLRLLADALHQADLGPRIRRRQGPAPRTGSGRVGTRSRPAQVLAARRWLLGELDGQVALPVTLVCDALGLDASVLAAAVRARTG
jgi:hypothetical protein